MNDNILISNQNLPFEVTISAPIHLQCVDITPKLEYYNAQGGKGMVTRSNYLRFNYGCNWCSSNQDDTGIRFN